MYSDIAVLGIGAIEQHGHHLPIGTDWMIAKELSERVAVKLKALLLPSIPVSMSECHGSFGGTVWLKPATLAEVIKDIARSLCEQSIHHLLIINCHGGNFILNPVIDEINQVYPDLQVTISDEMWPVTSSNKPIFKQAETDLHAGEIETSIMMFLYPQLVNSNKVDYVPPFGREFLDYVTMNQISPDGIWGTPSKGNAEKGATAIAEQVDIITAFALKEFKVKPC